MANTSNFQHLGWGRGQNGQLGILDAGEESELMPQPVCCTPAVGIACRQRILTVACGGNFTLLLTTHGDVWSCGSNESGELGYRTMGRSSARPQLALAKKQIIRLACGAAHTHATSADGKLYSWGRNTSGQLGLGHRKPTVEPCAVEVPPVLQPEVQQVVQQESSRRPCVSQRDASRLPSHPAPTRRAHRRGSHVSEG